VKLLADRLRSVSVVEVKKSGRRNPVRKLRLRSITFSSEYVPNTGGRSPFNELFDIFNVVSLKN
jgi:hypothetical protein